MVHKSTNYYWRHFDEIESRLDFVFYHPAFDYLDEIKKKHSVLKCGHYKNGVMDYSDNYEYFNSGVDFKGANYIEDGFYYYRAGDINDDNILEISEETKFVPIEFITENTPLLDEGDVLIIKDGATTGKIGIVKELTPSGTFNTHMFKIKPKEIRVNNVFLYYYLQTKIAQDQIRKLITGSAQGGITLDAIANLFIIAPDVTKQNKIVEKITPIVKDAETVRLKAKALQAEAANYLLAELKIIAPEDQNYFFKSGAEKQTITFIVSPENISDRIHYLYFHPKYEALKELCSNFKTVTLESICKREIAQGVQPSFVENGQKIALKTIDLKNSYIDYANALRVDEQFYNMNKFAEVVKDDIIIAATGYVSMGKIDVYDNVEPALISGELLSFSVNDYYDPYFIAFYLRSHLGQIQIEKYWTGSSGQIHLHDKDVKNFIIPSYESISKTKQMEIALVIKEKIEDAIKLEKQANEKQNEAIKLFENLVLKESKK